MTDDEPRRPILFLDVDGPLNPFRIRPEKLPAGYHRHEMRPDMWADPMLQPLRVSLNPEHGARLLTMPAELVWATTWEHDANTWIAPHLGLPELPVVEWPEDFNADAPVELCWKTPTLLEYAAGLPFVVVDDDVTDADQAWVAVCSTAPALFYYVDPARGLTDDDFQIVEKWLRGVETG